MDFKKFILENHPDPDSTYVIDNSDFEQIVVLAEKFAKELLLDFCLKAEEKALEYRHLVPSDDFINEYLTNK